MVREIKVEKADKAQRIPKDVTEKLKEMGIYRMVRFMRNEVINCPKEGRRSPIYCFLCEHFVRRKTGVIYCRYGASSESTGE